MAFSMIHNFQPPRRQEDQKRINIPRYRISHSEGPNYYAARKNGYAVPELLSNGSVPRQELEIQLFEHRPAGTGSSERRG
jgi:hypothetical protein